MRVSALGLAVLAWLLPGLALPLAFGLSRLRESFPPQLDLSKCRELPRDGDASSPDEPNPTVDEVLLGESLACPRAVVDEKGWRDGLAVVASEPVLTLLAGAAVVAGLGCAVLAVRATWRSRQSDPSHRRAWRLGLAALVVWLSGAVLTGAALLFIVVAAPIRG